MTHVLGRVGKVKNAAFDLFDRDDNNIAGTSQPGTPGVFDPQLRQGRHDGIDLRHILALPRIRGLGESLHSAAEGPARNVAHAVQDDKIHAVFGIFDENGDGYISLDEMYKFLTSVFKAGSCAPEVERLGCEEVLRGPIWSDKTRIPEIIICRIPLLMSSIGRPNEGTAFEMGCSVFSEMGVSKNQGPEYRTQVVGLLS